MWAQLSEVQCISFHLTLQLLSFTQCDQPTQGKAFDQGQG